jgi:acetyl esterase/lipase
MAMRCAIGVLSIVVAVMPVRADASAAYAVTERLDVEYRPKADGETTPSHNKIDLYLPEGAKDFPVVLIVHGGAWLFGDKSWDSIPGIARTLAKQGIGAVAVNYRLSPAVQFPAHVHDVADAFAWVHKNIADYGGRADRLTVMGHSAGGHLVTLLATDESHLKRVGLTRQNIQCVIGVSGVYQISEFALNAVARRRSRPVPGAPDATPFERIFGKQAGVAKQASPLTHVCANLPPFLLVYAESDIPTLGLQAMALDAALKANKCATTLLKAEKRNHATVMWRCSQADDPVLCAAVELIRKTCGHK